MTITTPFSVQGDDPKSVNFTPETRISQEAHWQWDCLAKGSSKMSDGRSNGFTVTCFLRSFDEAGKGQIGKQCFWPQSTRPNA